MSSPHFRIRFWGVRGSMPTPGARYIRTGGNTSCVSVEADDELVIIDAGSGLRELGLAMGEKAVKVTSSRRSAWRSKVRLRVR